MNGITQETLYRLEELAKAIAFPNELCAYTITHNKEVDERPIITVVSENEYGYSERTEYVEILDKY